MAHYIVKRGSEFVCADGSEKLAGERVELDEPHAQHSKWKDSLTLVGADPAPEPEPKLAFEEDPPSEFHFVPKSDDDEE